MTKFLLFQLYGPMASWGEVAVGEERDTASHPSRSAVLGLCAAALGISREQEEELVTLNKSLGFGVCVDEPGDILRDYHTVQSPTGKLARDLPTRRDELAYHNIEATLSKRHYRTDAFYTVCLWLRHEDGPFELAEISNALKNPIFTLFLGRKSCPLALPLAPEVVEIGTLLEAIQSYSPHSDLRWISSARRSQDKKESKMSIFWDADTHGIETGLTTIHTSKRWDRLVSRKRWQFARRDEAFAREFRTAPEEMK